MNLLFDPWIPVTTIEGKEIQISMYEIVRNDIVKTNATRADFNGALLTFLIGVLQTFFTPEDEDDWEEYFHQPPTEDKLKQVFEVHREAFNLDGDGKRFMQDYSIRNDGNNANVLKLLPGLLGDSAIIKNMDFLFKSSEMKQLPKTEVIMALYLYQIFCLSETGGKEFRHHGGLRRRNTVTVLLSLKSGSLWQNLWLNVIDCDEFLAFNQFKNKEYSFPWMEKKPYSKQKMDSDINISEIYWSMPRRVWILSDSDNNEMIRDILIKPDGIEYTTKRIRHPLVAYHPTKTGEVVRPVKISRTGLTYADWKLLVSSRSLSKNFQYLAENTNVNDIRLIAFGYINHPTQAKTQGWTQTSLRHLVLKNKSINNEIERYINVAKLIGDPNPVQGYLVGGVSRAWFSENKKKEKPRRKAFREQTSLLVSRSFWDKTEYYFYELVDQVLNEKNLSDELKQLYRKKWYKFIYQETIKLFNYWAFKANIQTNPKRISLGHKFLKSRLNGTKIKTTIGLAKEVNNEETT